jgi:FkbM family methyltransferase
LSKVEGKVEERPAPNWIHLAATVIRHLPMGRYRVMHRISRRPPAEFRMRMPAELGGYEFLCNLRDTICREVCFTGRYEPQETAVVRSILRAGMSFVDVGANWGYFTLMAASLVGPSGRVLSLEPDPRLYPILQANINRNHLEHVSALQVAAASEPGTLTLAGYDEDGENFGISRIVATTEEAKHSFNVGADSLDRILERQHLESADLMKMDIEGGEVFALPGLEESLRYARVKRLLLELHPGLIAEHGDTAAHLIQILQQAGYSGWTIDHSAAATRQAAYSKSTSAKGLLKPLNASDKLDEWPHQLWLAPGIEASCYL